MTFGAGSGWGGGGASGEEEPFRWFGPEGSGAFITPGPEWPLKPENLAKNKGLTALAVVLVILYLAGSSRS